jgi:lipopolysaccharide assembly outer membrane protein LptD (OstA)
MKPNLLFLFFAALAAAALTAEVPSPSAFVKPTVTTNGMWIWADGGFTYTGSNSTFMYKTNVRVADPQMFMQCELLTALYNTNDNRLEVIIAEDKVMLLTEGRQMLGDRAVYTASNDTVIVTGEMAALIDSRATLIGTNFVFNRQSNTAYSIGPVMTLLEGQGGFTPGDPLKRPGARAPK